MADPEAQSSEEAQITFNVKSGNDSKYVVTMSSEATVADLKSKLATKEYADIPSERQRLIYSGRVLKDHDVLSSTKLKDGHTIHLVKSAASNIRQNLANQPSSSGTNATSSSAASNIPSNIAAGPGRDPLAGLTGARYAGFMGLPSAASFRGEGMPSPETIERMMDDPNFLSQLNEMFNNPMFLEMIENSPMLRDNPMARQLLRDPTYRRMMFDPQMIRAQMRAQRSMGMMGGQSSFPMPGQTDNTPQGNDNQSNDSQSNSNQQQQSSTTDTPQTPPNPFLMNPPSADGNPFAALFGSLSPPPSTGPTTGNNAPDDGTQRASSNSPAGQNPFAAPQPFGMGGQGSIFERMMANPELLRTLTASLGGASQANPGETGVAGLGSGSASDNPFAALLSAMGNPVPPQPPDNRPPEERYADQLRQLNDMGFYEFERNIQALRRSGGSVQGAVEYLLGGDGGGS